MKICGRSDPGKERQCNEDNYFFKTFDDEGAIIAVADGMGGHAAGEVASSIAIDVLSRFVQDRDDSFALDEITGEDIKALINHANREIYSAGCKDKNKAGMGTTFTLGFIRNNLLIIGHVGDSRVYRLSGKKPEQLTEDHTVVEEMIKEGRISQKEAETHPRRHMITRALGISSAVEIDIVSLELNESDTLIFCTDGLTSLIEEKEIMQVITDKGDHPMKAVDYLVSLANERGGHDNITIVLVTDIGGF